MLASERAEVGVHARAVVAHQQHVAVAFRLDHQLDVLGTAARQQVGQRLLRHAEQRELHRRVELQDLLRQGRDALDAGARAVLVEMAAQRHRQAEMIEQRGPQ